ncbi:hypothetical protein Pmar_PMAR022218 [Perkinsus marinus ATCC 50983]|uniref:Uncharacterized protein n=1 Tax=Perkinsus marinus (strain ATCC 50983 / TXsc) TaxID=423536 RepID=C5LKF8_PERM5|nr:hypothetical protein Pmar_PMAR022218 [Perkinsus marinus ATCC 50983]EER02792.1 hypothetical protein Pmar_PMAR022218 [Perkinsus marinus ATCC 50983]|eukprot:XP_002770976.1 hypothetical protein Pmar_PMAR022218 [Perkinsus marinus ATCC 50983]
MWASARLLCLYVLSATADVDPYTGHPLQFYKEVLYPWNIKEEPDGCNESIPYVNYTWDYYFDYLVSSGATNLQLGGYSLNAKSEIKLDPPFYDPWNKTGFKALRKRVDAAGGVIMAELGIYLNKTFDKASFMESAKEFVKEYPVDGFIVGDLPSDFSEYPLLKELVAAIKELNLRVSLWFSTLHWQELKRTGLGKIVDSASVIPWPSFQKESIETFNTDRFAQDMIKDVVEAGVDLNKLILTIPLLARATYSSSDRGYSSAIYELGADPRGNGSVVFSDGSGCYFFSQTRAIEKVALAKKSRVPIMALLEDLSRQVSIIETKRAPADEEMTAAIASLDLLLKKQAKIETTMRTTAEEIDADSVKLHTSKL